MANDNQSRIVHVHDRAFRIAMSDLRVAKDFLSHYLSADVQQKIDLTTLKLEKDSYVSEELRMLVTELRKPIESHLNTGEGSRRQLYSKYAKICSRNGGDQR